MRLLVVGKLNGQLSTAVKMAMSAGAKVSHVETIAAATPQATTGVVIRSARLLAIRPAISSS